MRCPGAYIPVSVPVEGVVKGVDPFSLREKAGMRGPKINGLLILIPSP
jgi:hypothetical protein